MLKYKRTPQEFHLILEISQIEIPSIQTLGIGAISTTTFSNSDSPISKPIISLNPTLHSTTATTIPTPFCLISPTSMPTPPPNPVPTTRYFPKYQLQLRRTPPIRPLLSKERTVVAFSTTNFAYQHPERVTRASSIMFWDRYGLPPRPAHQR